MDKRKKKRPPMPEVRTCNRCQLTRRVRYIWETDVAGTQHIRMECSDDDCRQFYGHARRTERTLALVRDGRDAPV